MADRRWTKPQNDAITARGGSVLVSAAAGSGKTAVLVERVVRLICEEPNPVDVDRLLIVTFSNAAAAEMRQRVGVRLSQMMQQQPENLHLQRQHALLQKARISTIHSFCLSLIRENFQNLEVSPDFSIADPGEMDILRDNCVADCIEEFYAADEDGVFLDLVELLSTGRDDKRLAETVFRIYEFSRSHPFYEEWLDQKLDMYRSGIPVSETVWGRSILAHARRTLEFCVQTYTAAIAMLEGADEKLCKAYLPAFQSDMMQLERCLDAVADGDWDRAVGLAAAFTFVRLGAVRGEDADKARAKGVRDRTKKMIGDLQGKYLCATEADFRDDLSDLEPKISRLFALVKRYGQALDEAKAERRRLDFSDLEHLALRLLAEKTESGYVPTVHGVQVSSQFDYVLVDEYQDTNEAQDLIFTCVSRNGENLFMVGDVKQSIYGFRQAMPEIFLHKRESFYPYDGQSYPAAINLDTNFRSRSQVTDAVNFLFERIMSRQTGDIDYNGTERLRCGADYPETQGAGPELLLLSLQDDDSGMSAAEQEAAQVAAKIVGMLEGGYLVSDGAAMRPAAPRDFCILLRSPRNRADLYVKALGEAGIAGWAENAGSFLQAREVSMVVSLLKALDNPLLDIELVAALMSPLFGFTDDDIAEIRLCRREGAFYAALLASRAAGSAKAAQFLALFEELRTAAACLPADRLLLRLYSRTDALAIVQVMPMGESRKGNLLLLVEYAAQYHQLGYKRLGGFVGFLNRLEERGGDLSPAHTLGEGADVVRIMSVHRSKGLEFPIVILADTGKNFNKQDLRLPTLLHSQFGFACVRRDTETLRQYPTMPLQAIRLETQRTLLAEEMRVLYVALTRAKEKLVISAGITAALQKKLSSLAGELAEGKLSSHMVGEAAGYGDWILMALLHHASAGALREEGQCRELELLDDGTPWNIQIVRDFEGQSGKENAKPLQRTAQPDEALLSQLEERMAFVYPHANRTRIPTKLAVSTAAKGEQSLEYRFSTRPAFLTGQSLTAAEKGNAMHKFMQFADYEAARDNLEEEIRRMERDAFLSPLEVKSLSAARLRNFFESDLAKRIFASGKVWRELKFMAEFGKDMLGDLLPEMDDGSKVALQGVADCVFLEDGCAVIVDYKTDRVTGVRELKQRYARQLELYRHILAESLGVPVKECLLYSFALSRPVSV